MAADYRTARNSKRMGVSQLTRWMDARLYPSYQDHWDDRRFRAYVLERLKSHDWMLDLGAGRGAVPEMDFRMHAKFLAAVDPDPVVLENPFVHEAKLLDLKTGRIPYPDNTFDVVIANNVLEHLRNPELTFGEISRVLKPGGLFLGKTPNKRHYVPTVARFTPLSVHGFVNRLRGRDMRDTFPTLYRCNTPETIATHASKTGFRVCDVALWEGRPEYLRLSALTYLAGFLYERLVNTVSLLSAFRCVIAFTLGKQGRALLKSTS